MIKLEGKIIMLFDNRIDNRLLLNKWVKKGLNFLGFAICPTGLTVYDAALSRRDKKIAQLYEHGASEGRIGLYLARVGYKYLSTS